MENELKCDFIIEVNSYLEELAIAEECRWSSGESNELYLEIPYRGHTLCICPCCRVDNSEHMSLFFTDRIDDMQEIRVLLESINERLVVKGMYTLNRYLVLYFNPLNVIDDVKRIIKIVVEDWK